MQIVQTVKADQKGGLKKKFFLPNKKSIRPFDSPKDSLDKILNLFDFTISQFLVPLNIIVSCLDRNMGMQTICRLSYEQKNAFL